MEPSEIRKLRAKYVGADWFVDMIVRTGDAPELLKHGETRFREHVHNLPAGEFLAVWKNPKTNKLYRLHLKKVWIKPYTLSYRNTKTKDGKARAGNEILISSFPLPRGGVVDK
jgi:hypothetical protein